ncbi:MAG: sialate O-acetylesterase [Phycisphaerae bacterium]|nr:sialate O-acetylesterase [Phycisphaerae bacterium]
MSRSIYAAAIRPFVLIIGFACALSVSAAPPAATLTAAAAPRLRVYLLAGQSNMEGHGVVDLDDAKDYNGGRGNLAAFVADPAHHERWKQLRNADGTWTTRDDVFVSYLTENKVQKAGPLSVGFAVYDDRHHFGPELGIGDALGSRLDEPVLLIKTAWGGKSLAKDFRPPSAGGEVGPYYAQMLKEYRAAIAAIPTALPALAGRTPQLDGVIWFQGWNDGCDDKAAAEYEENLVYLITDLRHEFGVRTLPFVVGETGNHDSMVLRNGQKAACARKEVSDGARFVPTSEFRRKPEESPNPGHIHHWSGSSESYLLIGDALGRAMAELVVAREKAPAPTPAPAKR